MEMPPPPAWLAGHKRGPEDPNATQAAGAKILRSGDKGSFSKGGKGKRGKGKSKTNPESDEHPGATWAGSEGGQAEREGQSWDWNYENEWGTGEWTSGEGAAAAATGGGGGGRRPNQGRDRHRDATSDLEAAMTSMQKLTLRNATDLRVQKHLVQDFWLIPLNSPAAKAGLEGGKKYGAQVRELGKGHGMGPPHLTVALYVMKALQAYADEWIRNEGIEKETAWAEITIRNFLVEAYNATYGQSLVKETFLEFHVTEAYTGKKEEGLMIEEPTGGQAKMTIAFNHNPLMQVALLPHKTKIEEEKWKQFAGFQTANLRQATGYILHKMRGKKGDAAGPKTQLERAVEGNMRKLQGRIRQLA